MQGEPAQQWLFGAFSAVGRFRFPQDASSGASPCKPVIRHGGRCVNRNASRLVIHASAREAKKLDIYRKFAVHMDEIISHHGRARTLETPADAVTCDELVMFMAEIAGDFREMPQDDDPVAQQYAKLGSFS